MHPDAGNTSAANEGAVSVYSFVATAIARRPLVVRTSPAHSAAYTDGASVFIPSDCPVSDRFKVVALHAGLLAIGSVDRQTTRRLSGRPRTIKRYFALEADRARHQLDGILPRHSLDFGHQAALSSSATQSLAIAKGAAPVTELAGVWGELRPSATARRLAATADDTQQGKLRLRGPEDLAPDADDEEDAEQSAALRNLNSPLGSEFWAKMFAALGATSKKGTSSTGAPFDGSVGRHLLGRRVVGRGVSVSMGVPKALASSRRRDEPGTQYPEWDVNRSAYRDAWCTVREQAVPSEAERVPAHPLIRQRLGRTRLDLRRSRHEIVGDELDLDSIVAARCDIRSGRQPDDHLYTALRRLGRDLAVLILVDSSGSVADPAASSGTVSDAQTKAAIRLARTLERRGDRVAIHGFNSRGRSDVYLYRVKDFRHTWDGTWQSRLRQLDPAGFTRMGAAIRHSVTLLTQGSRATREILVVLSDGIPYDEGYEGHYASADAKRALTEAREAGVGCLCLSLGGALETGDLESVFGTAAFARADDIDDLGPGLNRLFNEALFAAERAQRRRLGAARQRNVG